MFSFFKYFTVLSTTMILSFFMLSDYSMYLHFNYKKKPASSSQFHFARFLGMEIDHLLTKTNNEYL